MKLAAAALTLVLLTGLAHAQTGTGINLWADDGKPKDPEAEAKQREIDKAYREKTKSQAAPAAAADPWGTVRSSDKPASQGKAQSNSKTSNTAR
jgi:hypothetical protein